MNERATPETQAAEFPADVSVGKTEWCVRSDFARRLEQQRDEAREKLKYWKGVVRGARAELHQMERLTDEEYVALCSDSECRDHVDMMDALKKQRDELLEKLKESEAAWWDGQSEFGIEPVCLTKMAVVTTLKDVRDAKIDALKEQRDELLEALEKQACLTAYYNGHSDGYKPHPNGGLFWENYLCPEARSAIAAVKGNQ